MSEKRSVTFWLNASQQSIPQNHFSQVSSNDKKSRFVKGYTNKENGAHALLESLRAANTYELLDDNLYSNQNLNYDKLHSCIMELKEKHLSYKLVKFNKYKHKGNKSITNGMIKSLKLNLETNYTNKWDLWIQIRHHMLRSSRI